MFLKAAISLSGPVSGTSTVSIVYIINEPGAECSIFSIYFTAYEINTLSSSQRFNSANYTQFQIANYYPGVAIFPFTAATSVDTFVGNDISRSSGGLADTTFILANGTVMKPKYYFITLTLGIDPVYIDSIIGFDQSGGSIFVNINGTPVPNTALFFGSYQDGFYGPIRMRAVITLIGAPNTSSLLTVGYTVNEDDENIVRAPLINYTYLEIGELFPN